MVSAILTSRPHRRRGVWLETEARAYTCRPGSCRCREIWFCREGSARGASSEFPFVGRLVDARIINDQLIPRLPPSLCFTCYLHLHSRQQGGIMVAGPGANNLIFLHKVGTKAMPSRHAHSMITSVRHEQHTHKGRQAGRQTSTHACMQAGR